jgi:predicted nucleic acid-binding protein
VKEILSKEVVKTTTITEYELLRHKTKIKKQAAERFLSGVIVCSFDRDAAKKAAELFQELQDVGRMVNENDLLIAGIALAHDEILLTRDQKLASIGKDKIRTV